MAAGGCGSGEGAEGRSRIKQRVDVHRCAFTLHYKQHKLKGKSLLSFLLFRNDEVEDNTYHGSQTDAAEGDASAYKFCTADACSKDKRSDDEVAGVLMAYTSPMCSITGAMATGIMKMMASTQKSGFTKAGRANQGASTIQII